jgi:hypothetical protein
MSSEGSFELMDRVNLLPIRVIVEDLSQDGSTVDSLELDSSRLMPPARILSSKARSVPRRRADKGIELEEGIGLIASASEETLVDSEKVPIGKHGKTKRHYHLHILKGLFVVAVSAAYLTFVVLQLVSLNSAGSGVEFVGQNCSAGAGRLVPSTVLFGASLDWQVTKPDKLVTSVPLRVFGGFIKMDSTTFQQDMAIWYAQSVANPQTTPILLLTVIPTVSLDKLSLRVVEKFAALCRRINYELGVPLMVRFAHEMNGNWNPYGQRPMQFVETWKTLTSAIRDATNMTAMLWAPNMAVGYPFGELAGALDGRELARLDTNGNGRLDVGDDPYTPYFPGREFVDWIGLSIYWFGTNTRDMENQVPPRDYFLSALHGITATSREMRQPVWDFVEMFPDLPIAIPETGAAWYVQGKQTDGEVSLKQAWWQQTVISRPWLSIPRLKLVQFFEERKLEERGLVDYRVLSGSLAGQFWREFDDAAMEGDLVESLPVACNGTIGDS